ncbi:MAG: GNAT family protein [Phycisphaerales bacterium]
MPIAALPLAGPHAALEPLTEAHAAALLAAADERTFEHMPARPPTWDAQGFRAYAAELNGNPRVFPHAVLDARTGDAVGVTALYDPIPAHRGVSIGYTWLGPASRGTPINPEMKLLLMTRAFETDLFARGSVEEGSAIRVQLKTDARNERSQRAMERLGFAREGTLRAHVIMPDGYRRDSVIYSVIEQEWPGVRERLATRIAQLSQP